LVSIARQDAVSTGKVNAERERHMVEKQAVRFVRPRKRVLQANSQSSNDWIADWNARLIVQLSNRPRLFLKGDIVKRGPGQVEL
jgi:hypothetical protein